MVLKSGFFNAKVVNNAPDRVYDAIDMSSIFDGIILDGIFAQVGNAFMVTALTGNQVTVDTGRAWFKQTWSVNDAKVPLTMPNAEVVLSRIDAVVLEVDSNVAVRANKFAIVKGTPASFPVRPTLHKSSERNQYALAYITRAPNTTVTQGNITRTVGTNETPFVTGPLKTISADVYTQQWGAQWKEFYDATIKAMNLTADKWKNDWSTWYKEYTTVYAKDFLDWTTAQKKAYADWVALNTKNYSDWTTAQKLEYTTWTDAKKAEYTKFVKDNTKIFTDWVSVTQSDYNKWTSDQKVAYTKWIDTQKQLFTTWKDTETDLFEVWLAGLQAQTSGNQVIALKNRIDELEAGLVVNSTKRRRTIFVQSARPLDDLVKPGDLWFK